jgi:hypothetical protein
MIICVSKQPTASVFRRATYISEELTTSVCNIEVISIRNIETAIYYSIEEIRKLVFHFRGRILHARKSKQLCKLCAICLKLKLFYQHFKKMKTEIRDPH